MCIDLAYIDKLAKDNNGVKYLLVRQDLFDRTADAKKWKQKIWRRRFEHFRLWLEKRIVPKNFVLTREQTLLKSSKNYAQLKEYNFTV